MKIKKCFVKRKVGDKYLVVTTGKAAGEQSMFIELNETSSYIWDMIEKGYDEDKMAFNLCKMYSIPREKALGDIRKLVASMQEAGIFEE